MSAPHATFLVERYWPDSSPAEFERATARIVAEIAGIADGAVTLVHSTYIPADDAAQWVIRAPSVGAVEALCLAADVEFQRLRPAIESPRPTPE
jgi:hypothetical protein